jgi:hypothetical membrane protein
MSIKDLALDLSDGLKLINLLEQISAKKLPKYNKVVKHQQQKLENVGVALKFLKDEGLKLVAIGPEGILLFVILCLSFFIVLFICIYVCLRCLLWIYLFDDGDIEFMIVYVISFVIDVRVQ